MSIINTDFIKPEEVDFVFAGITKHKNFSLLSSPIYRIHNLNIEHLKTNSENIININKNVFIIDLDIIDSHFHFLNDILGQFLIIKKQIPDIEPVAVLRTPKMMLRPSFVSHSKDLKKKQMSEYVYDALNKIGIDENKIIDINKNKILLFNNVFIIDPRWNQYFKNVLFDHDIYYDPSLTSYELKRLLGIKNTSIKNKIFISRMPENNKVRFLKRRFDSTGNLGPYFNAVNFDSAQLKNRFISYEDEKMIEKFFIDAGYRIIVPSRYSLAEQIKIFANATHVAGLSGAGFINTIFCNDVAKIIIIRTSSEYDFEHEYWPSSLGHTVISIPDKTEIGNNIIRLSGNDIMKKLSLMSDML